MNTSLTTFIFQIQTVLFTVSGALLLGSLYALYGKGRVISNDKYPQLLDSQKTTSAEKRQERRRISNCPFELMNRSGVFLANSARIRDLSAKGACFESPLFLKKGERIEAKLHSPNEGLLRISGRVVWVKSKTNWLTYGVKFDTIRQHLS
jgi:hypothetical protein